jgi:hypothetical protein
VIYGSYGFNSYGFKGGCTFTNGTFEEALASPPSARYFCNAQDKPDNGDFQCLHDHAGSGICTSSHEGFTALTGVCYNLQGARTVERSTLHEQLLKRRESFVLEVHMSSSSSCLCVCCNFLSPKGTFPNMAKPRPQQCFSDNIAGAFCFLQHSNMSKISLDVHFKRSCMMLGRISGQ